MALYELNEFEVSLCRSLDMENAGQIYEHERVLSKHRTSMKRVMQGRHAWSCRIHLRRGKWKQGLPFLWKDYEEDRPAGLSWRREPSAVAQEFSMYVGIHTCTPYYSCINSMQKSYPFGNQQEEEVRCGSCDICLVLALFLPFSSFFFLFFFLPLVHASSVLARGASVASHVP